MLKIRIITRRILIFELVFIFKAADINLRDVLITQNLVPQEVASVLFITYIITAYEGIQPAAVISYPKIRNKAIHMNTYNLFEASLVVLLGSFNSDLSFLKGEGQYRHKKENTRKIIEIKQYASSQSHLIMKGTVKAPMPKHPCVRGSHEPTFCFAISMRQIFNVIKVEQCAPPKKKKLSIYPQKDSHSTKLKRNIKVRKPQVAMIVCQLIFICFP